MLTTLLALLAIWFFASIPLALLVGRLLAAKDRVVVIETIKPSEAEPSLIDRSA